MKPVTRPWRCQQVLAFRTPRVSSYKPRPTQSLYIGELLATLQLVTLPAVHRQHAVQSVPRARFSAQAPVLFSVALVTLLDCKL